MQAQNDTQKFIDLYNSLDDYMRKYLRAERHVDHSSLLYAMIDKNRIFSAYSKDLRMFAEIRNMLVHNPYPQEAKPLLYPHEYIVKKYEEILALILFPQKALSVAVPSPKIYKTTLSANAQELMEVMVKNNFTHIPVIENDSLVGIFSENTLLSYVVSNKECIILPDTLVKEFEEFVYLDKHMNEIFEFVSRNTLLSDVEELFNKGMKAGKRIAVVFVTEHGKSAEKILGMITPWDLTSSR